MVLHGRSLKLIYSIKSKKCRIFLNETRVSYFIVDQIDVFFHLCRMIKALQQAQQRLATIYLMKNTLNYNITAGYRQI